MGKSKQGGVFGFIRGKVGSATYSVLPAKASKSGKKEQIVRALPESVANPQTVGQVMQRMKVAPAQKFYAAFAQLLNNAFQGVAYGEESRRYFLKKAMMADGPYIQKGVDRFIPAQYLISEGSIPSVVIKPFSSADVEAHHSIVLDAPTQATTPTVEDFAAALGVTPDYQISVIIVTNENGIFVPQYVPFADRLKIADLPAGSFLIEDNNYKILPFELGLDDEQKRVVAAAVVLSVQDASGAWLRSTQNLVISDELIAQLYGADALQAAIYSYQTNNGSANAINSQWYYNLGANQAFNGKLTTNYLTLASDAQLGDYTADTVVGMRQINGGLQYVVFADSLEDSGLIKIVKNGEITTNARATVAAARQSLNSNFTIELWYEQYAAQLGILNIDSINGAFAIPTTSFALNDDENINIVAIGWAGIQDKQYYAAVSENGDVYYFINVDVDSPSYANGVISLDGNLSNSWKVIIDNTRLIKTLPLSNPSGEDPDPKPANNFNLLKQLAGAKDSIWG